MLEASLRRLGRENEQLSRRYRDQLETPPTAAGLLAGPPPGQAAGGGAAAPLSPDAVLKLVAAANKVNAKYKAIKAQLETGGSGGRGGWA